ncbi:MAG: succinylglutamate desuccinylase [Porticoccus sp.]|jgi:hypothetical protein|nr:succinylglutamate desuccinylase [Porticoccus sp.]|tara:strand:- start:3563 stop:4252 length:690 start_codon:yes stop_codon:yes gene_type:complete
MKPLNSQITSQFDSLYESGKKVRHVSQGSDPKILANIYREDTNIVIWKRSLPETLIKSVDAFALSNPNFRTSMTLSPGTALSRVSESIGDPGQLELSKNIAELVDIFCHLFELKQAGLRLVVLDRAMCTRFHVDKIPCRLITTFQGIATEWLPQEAVDRKKLGAGSKGKPDSHSGIYKDHQDIRRLSSGDVALLKGELWQDNKDGGLVHRSPDVPADKRRLMLTLDFSS